MGRYREGRERTEVEREGGVEWGRRPGTLAKRGRSYLDICAGISEFVVTPLLMGSICVLS